MTVLRHNISYYLRARGLQAAALTLLLAAAADASRTHAHAFNSFSNPSTGGDRPRMRIDVSSGDMSSLFTAWGGARGVAASKQEAFAAAADQKRQEAALDNLDSELGKLRRRGYQLRHAPVHKHARTKSQQSRAATESVTVRGRLLHAETRSPVQGVIVFAKPGVDAVALVERYQQGAISRTKFLKSVYQVSTARPDGYVKSGPLPRGVRITAVALASGYHPEYSAVKLRSSDPDVVQLCPFQMHP